MTRLQVLSALLVGASLTLLGGAVPSAATAQVNIEAARREDPPPGLSGSVGGNLAVQTGNVDLVQIGLSGRVYRVTGPVTSMLVGNGGIGLLGGSRFSSAGLIHLRQTRRINSWLSPEWYGQINYDRAQLLAFRVVAGGGARARVAEGAWGRVWGGTALMLEHERLTLPDTAVHPRRTTVLRASSFAAVRVATNDQLVITSTTYVQPRVSALGDVRMLENFALAVSVTTQVAVTVSFDLRYDSRPPDGIASLDTSLRSGVTLTY